MTRVRERIAGYERESQRIAGERQSREAFIAERQQEMEQQEEQRQQLEAQMSAAQEHVAELRLARDDAAQAASEVMARVAGLEERRRAAAASLARIQSMAAEVNQRVSSLRAQLEGAAAEQAQRQQENELLAGGFWSGRASAKLAHAREQELMLRERTGSRAPGRTRSGIEGRARGSGQRSRPAWRVERAGRQNRQRHRTPGGDLHSGAEPEPRRAARPTRRWHTRSGDELAATDAGYREMRVRLEGMGPVNMMALEEYTETAQRHEFLETQRKDLLDSIENTQNTIKEIEEISRGKFNDAFAIINANFTRTFKKLFGGGEAWMKLTDEENSAESGIDIVASPPGKKMQNVLLLSGGEKAMTALSLLVGIFQYAPAPFCILDEVDAPLDEANVTRFGELMREMSMETQFILITHHKKTMSMAPVLYGVTMQEPGVSRIVSVRFGATEHEQLQAATA